MLTQIIQQIKALGHIGPQRRKDLVPFDAKSSIHMVRLAGIEPTTPWFVAKYSIQLSYSRYGENSSMQCMDVRAIVFITATAVAPCQR